MANTLSPGGYVRQGQKGAQPARAVNVQVAVRCRPLNDRERSSGDRQTISCDGSRREVHFTAPNNARKGSIAAGAGKRTFTYDHVFGPDASQQDVYEGVVQPIVDEVLEGYNCTVFAYGQTGTGKTHTMEGRRDESTVDSSVQRLPENAGMIPRAVKQVFDHLRSITDEHSVRVSHLELYNEQLTDLLGSEDDTELRMYEDSQKGTFVNGLDEIVVRNEEEIFAILDKSAMKRRTAETLMNKFSSRSHSVFSITIHIKESTPDGADLLKVGKLNLVDLAGSENVGRSGAVKGRAREAGNINQSLLTLGRVITALVEHHPHIPYRDSKLTRLLQESLGGRNKTCIIATATPGSSSYEETASTLDYAYRAKNIKNRPTVNQMIAKHVLLKEYTDEITKLKRELEATRAKNGVYLPTDEFERLQANIKNQTDSITELEERREEDEKRRAALKETLERTQGALSRSQRELDETRLELSSVEAELENKKLALSSAIRERDEERYIVREHEITERELHEQGQSLQSTISSCIDDISKLQDSVDAKNILERENVTSVSVLRSEVTQGTTAICKSLDEYKRSQDIDLANTEKQVQSYLANVELGLAAVSGCLRDLMNSVASHQTEQRSAEESFAQQLYSGANAFRDNAAEATQCQVGRLSAIQEDVSSACESVDTVLSNLCADIDGLNDTIKQFSSAQVSVVRDMVKSQKDRVQELDVDVQRLVMAQDLEFSKLEADISESTQIHTAEMDKAAKDAIADITNVLAKFVESSTSRAEKSLSGTKNRILQTKATSEQLGKSVSGHCQDLIEFADNFENDCQKSQQNLLKSVETFVSESTEGGCVGRKVLDEQRRRVGDLLAEVKNNERKLQGNIDQHCSKVKDLVDADRTRRGEAKSSLCAILSEGDRNYSLQVEESQSAVSRLSQFASSCTERSAASVAAMSDATKMILTEKVASRVDSFQLHIDSEQSSIPKRKQWIYPSQLRKTKSRSELVHEYRNMQRQSSYTHPGDPIASIPDSSGDSVCTEDLKDENRDTLGMDEAEYSRNEQLSELQSVSSEACSDITGGEVPVSSSDDTRAQGPGIILRDETNRRLDQPSSKLPKKAGGIRSGIRRPRTLSTKRTLS